MLEMKMDAPHQPAGHPKIIPSLGKKLGELDWNESLNT
jgi:hypothetical protein